VDIPEGKTQQLNLGGQGRPVLGKIQLDGFDARFDWRQDFQTLRANVPRPAVLQQVDEAIRAAKAKFEAAPTQGEKDQLKHAAELQESEIREKVRTFYASTAGREYNPHQIYALNFSQDGSFRIEDVPAGTFALEIVLHERGRLPGVPSSQLARVVQSIEVPATNNAAPLDVGTIQATPQIPALTIGQTAPDFQVNDLTGTPFKLSDFKGKYVLLEFWAVWCPPCIGEIPHLKETYEAFNNNERFVMISLSLDENPLIARKFIEEHSIAWTQGFLGEWPPGPIAKSYRVIGPPYIYLIGPDGKVVASRLRGPNIKQAVEAVLQPR
jgi:thiol-disulfide isomerase/thioredoxin